MRKALTAMEATGAALVHHIIITFWHIIHHARHASVLVLVHRLTNEWICVTTSYTIGVATDAMAVKA